MIQNADELAGDFQKLLSMAKERDRRVSERLTEHKDYWNVRLKV